MNVETGVGSWRAGSPRRSAAIPATLGFAAGVMLYVVVDELIPESHAAGHELEATLALIAGFALMVALDTAL